MNKNRSEFKGIFIPRDHWICKWSDNRLYASIHTGENLSLDEISRLYLLSSEGKREDKLCTGDVVCYDSDFNLVWVFKNDRRIPVHHMVFYDDEIELSLNTGGRIWLDYEGNLLKFEEGR